MLGGEDNENGEKTTIGLMSKKATFTRAVHFFVYFIAVALHDYNVKLPETSWLHVLCRKRRTCSCSPFFTVAHFHHGGRQHFSFSHHCYKISCCSSNKKCLLCFFSLSLQLFFSLSFAGLSSTFSFSLSVSVSLFSKSVDITKFSFFHRLPISVGNGAPPRAVRRRGSYAKIIKIIALFFFSFIF